MYKTYHAQAKEESPRPPVKWAGGKSQLIPRFEQLFPKREYTLYVEPFVGGGAVFFHLLPPRAVLIDSNDELINFYLVVRDNLEALLQDLRRHENTAEYYYRIRALEPGQLTPVERASRFLYLNKTGYNGLWRVNSRGQHNVPFGRYKNPKIVDEPNFRLVSGALKRAEIICDDFSRVLDCADRGAFVYL
ncbi:DNA adenine methylase, partial [Desulfofundulus thermocisternus]|uniref:DNA adenine methylase n=1 Tax=Desulfofundulus thermocisternus TaxID=42471 RepID=UPI00217EE409